MNSKPTVKRRSFGSHAGNYVWAELVIAAVGLLSFPILTRLLSVSDYGTMNLVGSVLAVTVAIGKVGMQHAALRGWAEVRAGHSAHTPAAFEATVIWGMAWTGLGITVLWAFATALIPDSWWGGEVGVAALMLLTAPLIVLRVLDSALTCLLRAQESTAALAWYGSIRRVALFLAVVGVLWAVTRNLKAFFLVTIAVELLAVLALFFWMYRRRPWPKPSQLSGSLWTSLAVFGFPMLGSELANVVLAMGDRFVVQGLLGTQSLGIYAATFNMCDHLRSVLLGALTAAAYPRCMALWENEGPAGLRRFLQIFMNYYAAVAIFMVALMVTAGGELMVILASEKYATEGHVAGWIMAGLAIQTVGNVAAVGIFIAKRTLLAMSLLLVGGLLSIATNWLLVPVAGLQGSGWAIVVTSLALVSLQMLAARPYAPVVVPWRALVQFSLAAAAAVGLAFTVTGSAGWLHLLLRCAVLVTVYLSAVLVIDPDIRHRVFRLLLRRNTAA